MSSYPQITAALESRLASLTPKLDTAWENVKFTTPTDAYQIVNFLPADVENPTFGNGMYRERGIMQVTLSYPVNGGAGAARARAEAIRDWFPRASTFASSGVTVIIDRTPSIAYGRVVDGRYMVPVSIRYFANIM